MKNPFKKIPPETIAAEDGQVSGSETGLEKNKKFRLKLSVKSLFVKKEDAITDTVSGEALAGQQKPKKEKREKPQKINRSDVAQKKMPVLPFVIIGAVLITAAVVTAMLVARGGETVEDKLQKAAAYTAEEKYEDAQTIYSKLLDEDITLVDAYLGLADNHLVQQQRNDAVLILKQGLTATQDERIQVMLDEIQPAEEEPPAEAHREEGPPPPSEEPIVWQDAALESMVRDAMSIPQRQSVSEKDLEKVTILKIMGPTHSAVNETVSALITMDGYTVDGVKYTEHGEIRTLADLAHFTNLRKISIGYNKITDINGIAELTKLDTLALYFNDISDLSALSGLENLRELYLYSNKITSIAPLAELTNMKTLYLQHNQIVDLSPLKNMSLLTDLYVSGNRITDIGAVSGLKALRFFFADDNQIGDLSPLAGIKTLTDVSISGNPVTDYSPVEHVHNVNKSR